MDLLADQPLAAVVAPLREEIPGTLLSGTARREREVEPLDPSALSDEDTRALLIALAVYEPYQFTQAAEHLRKAAKFRSAVAYPDGEEQATRDRRLADIAERVAVWGSGTLDGGFLP